MQEARIDRHLDTGVRVTVKLDQVRPIGRCANGIGVQLAGIGATAPAFNNYDGGSAWLRTMDIPHSSLLVAHPTYHRSCACGDSAGLSSFRRQLDKNAYRTIWC